MYRQTGDIVRARQWASYAWQESQIINHPRCAVEAAMECARLTLLEGKHLAAEQWVQQLGELLKTNELGRYQGIVHLLQALTFLQSNNSKAAVAAAQYGLETIQKRNEHRYLSLAHVLLSLVAQQQQDKDEVDRQLVCARQALHEKVNKISDSPIRRRFLQATPLRLRISAAELPSLPELFQYS